MPIRDRDNFKIAERIRRSGYLKVCFYTIIVGHTLGFQTIFTGSTVQNRFNTNINYTKKKPVVDRVSAIFIHRRAGGGTREISKRVL